MKKRTAAAFIAAMTITTLTACGGPKQLSKSVTVELGKEDGIKVTDVLDISKDKAKDVKIDTKKVNFYKEGKYDATLTYDKKEYKITVKIKDTVAPEATAKESITVQTGTAVHVTDCLDKVTEASGNIKAEFETKPETDTAQGTETTESTEKAETTESTDKSSVSSSESVANTTEATETQSQAIAVGDVNLSSNDEITYVTAGDYDNNIVVTDDAGNETKVPVKISVINPPTINGVTDKTVTVGDTIDYMAGVTATDGKGADITSSVTVDSSAVKTDTAGTYQAAYKVTDANGYTGSATSNVTVNEKSPVVSDDSKKPKEEPKQEAADNSDSSSKSDSKKNNSSSKKHHSSSGSASSNNASSGNGGQSASNGGGSSSGGSGSSGSSDNGGGSSSGGSSSSGSNITPVNRADVPAGWKLVNVGDGKYIAANPNAGKYDTAYASNANWGCWANGTKYSITDFDNANMGSNRDAALYFVAAGMMDKAFFNDVYGQ